MSQPHSAVWAIPAAMLLIAMFALPYGYYTALRIVVCGAAAYLVYHLWNERDEISLWIFVFFAIAILFNPVFPVHLTKSIWTPLNFGSAVCFALHWWQAVCRGANE